MRALLILLLSASLALAQYTPPPATGVTLPVSGADGGTGVANTGKTITLAGTGSPTWTLAQSINVTLPNAATATMAITNGPQTFTGTQTFGALVGTTGTFSGAVTATGSAGYGFAGAGLRVSGPYGGGIWLADDASGTNPFGFYSSGATLQFLCGGTARMNLSSSGLDIVNGLTIGGGTSMAKVKHGTAVLVAGVATVSDASTVDTGTAATSSLIFINRAIDGGTIGDSFSIVKADGSQFTITSQTATLGQTGDTSTVSWLMINP